MTNPRKDTKNELAEHATEVQKLIVVLDSEVLEVHEKQIDIYI